jgi:IS5 family transposase
LANNLLLHLEDIRHVHARLLNAIRTEGRSQQACARANRETQGEHPPEVKHPFRVIKRRFGLLKVRFRGLATNTAHVITPFALSNLWMVRRRLLATTGALRPQFAK